MSAPTTGTTLDSPDDPSAAEVENHAPPTLTLRAYLSESRAAVIVIAVTVFGIFAPAVIVPYAFSDDYSILWMAVSGEPSPSFGKTVFDANAIGGRPLGGLLEEGVFRAAGKIADLRFLRLLAIVAIIALALLLHWALVRAGIRPTPAALMAVLVCSLPAFQVYASWAVLFVAPLAALLGGGASVLAIATIDGPRDLVADRLVGAGAMLLAALLIYQPAAMFFWVFLAVALVGARHESGRARRIVRTHFGIAAVALPLAFLAAKLGTHIVGNGASNEVRSRLTHDVVGKARWFFEQPLYRSLNLFDLTPSPWLAAGVAAVATGGILLLLRRRCASPPLYLGLAVLLIPVSYLPNLVVKENLATYRTQVSISSLIALYFCLGAIGIWLAVRDWLRPRVSENNLLAVGGLALAASVAFVAASAFFAAKNVTTLFALPQMTELRIIRSQVAALPPGAPKVAFAGVGYHEGMTDLVIYDEFGLPSSSQVFTEAPSVFLVLREEGRLTPHGPKPQVDILPWPTTTLPKDEPVVDVRGLTRLR